MLQLTYLKFVGGIKLREALSHFQKETMTDELTCKFTYWGRTKESLPFYNTQIAKVYFCTYLPFFLKAQYTLYMLKYEYFDSLNINNV